MVVDDEQSVERRYESIAVHIPRLRGRVHREQEFVARRRQEIGGGEPERAVLILGAIVRGGLGRFWDRIQLEAAVFLPETLYSHGKLPAIFPYFAKRSPPSFGTASSSSFVYDSLG